MNTLTAPAPLPHVAEVPPKPKPVIDWLPGAPHFINESSILIDQRTCRRMRCKCGNKGLEYHPQHAGLRCRVLGICPACGHQEVL